MRIDINRAQMNDMDERQAQSDYKLSKTANPVKSDVKIDYLI